MACAKAWQSCAGAAAAGSSLTSAEVLRFLAWLAALHHRRCLLALRDERAWHARCCASLDHPYLRGLDWQIAHHDRQLAELGYLLVSAPDETSGPAG